MLPAHRPWVSQASARSKDERLELEWLTRVSCEALGVGAAEGVGRLCAALPAAGLASSAKVLWWRGPLAPKGRCSSVLRRRLGRGEGVESRGRLVVPLRFRGETVGALQIERPFSRAPHPIRAIASLIEGLLPRAEREREDLSLRRELLACRARSASEARCAHLRHDLKNPLVSVKGYAEMMLRGMAGETTPKMRTYLERIGASVARQRELIDHAIRAEAWNAPMLELRGKLFQAGLDPGEGPPCPVRGTHAELDHFCRVLARVLPKAAAISLRGDEHGWILETPRLPARPAATLGALSRRLGGSLRSPASA